MDEPQPPPPPIGLPGPLTQAAIDKARSLPDNTLDLSLGSTDFKSVEATVAVRKTWRNGWGAGVWVAAKIGAGKPVGSAGVTVTKTLGLLGEVDTMNWLQRNLPSRESWAWVIATAASGVTFLFAHFETLQAAFDLAPAWEKRLELLAGLAALLTAKQSFSWMPTKANQDIAIEVKAIEKVLDRRPDPPQPPTS